MNETLSIMPSNRVELQSKTAPQTLNLASVVEAWRNTGPTVFKSTGIEAIDGLFGGKGLPLPRRVVLIGCPGAGKTALAAALADALDRSGDVLVGFVAVDEEAEELGYRFAQMSGCDREKLEAQDPTELEKADGLLSASNIVFYDHSCTLEAAVEDVARRAREANKLPALFVDSLSTATTLASKNSATPLTPRQSIEACITVLENAYAKHRMFVLATAEANRAAYSSQISFQNPLAAGAESRKLEFGFQTNLVLSINEADALITNVVTAKNRKYAKSRS